MKFTYLQNSGLYVQSASANLLIDALYSNDNWFSVMQLPMERAIIEGMAPFQKIDALIYTHQHSDHYDQTKADEFLKRTPNTQLLIGLDGQEEYQKISFDDLQMEIITTKHLPVPGFPEVPHTSILLELDEKRIFIGADMEFQASKGRAWDLLREESFAAVFFNPLAMATKGNRELLATIDTGAIYIYHLPEEQDDRFGYRKLAIQCHDMDARIAPRITLLTQSMTTIDLI